MPLKPPNKAITKIIRMIVPTDMDSLHSACAPERSRMLELLFQNERATGDANQERHNLLFVNHRGQCKRWRRDSMTNRFLISVAAAALIAGTGFANAQGMNREGGGAAGGGSTTQQGGGAPSEKGGSSAAPMNRDSGPSGTKAGEKAGGPGGMKGAQTDKMEGGKNAQSDKIEGT